MRSRSGPNGEVAEENNAKGGRGSEPRRRHGLRSIEGGASLGFCNGEMPDGERVRLGMRKTTSRTGPSLNGPILMGLKSIS